MKTYSALKPLVQFFIFLVTTASFSQNCLPDGIVFSSQLQIDDFVSDYNDCTIIDGDVRIFNAAGDITNLNGLSELTKIGGNLEILLNANLLSLDGLDKLVEVDGFLAITYSNNLSSLSGLGSLTTVGGKLEIQGTDISDLSGLGKLQSVNGDLSIFDNDILTTLTGLEKLTSIGGNFILEQSNLLADVEGLKELVSIGGDFEISYLGVSDFIGLEKLISIGGELKISYNDNLSDLTGLESLATLNGHMRLFGNSALSSFQGLQSLTTIGGILSISNNDVLTSLNGMENLNSVGNYLYIANNDELTSLNGLNNLITIGGNLGIVNNEKLIDISAIEQIDPTTIESNNTFSEDLEIRENDLLSVCENLAVCLALDSGKSANITNNAVGCNSISEVEFECESSILPVIWSKPLRVSKGLPGHNLTFSTSYEVNNDMFILERSHDGIHFQSIQNINGHGNSSKEIHYSISDDDPLEGMNYYRVKQVDYDTNYSYSNIVAINNSIAVSQLQLYPNPVSTDLNIFNANEETNLQILNSQGELVQNLNVTKGLNTISFDNYPKGMYFAKSQNGKVYKIIIE